MECDGMCRALTMQCWCHVMVQWRRMVAGLCDRHGGAMEAHGSIMAARLSLSAVHHAERSYPVVRLGARVGVKVQAKVRARIQARVRVRVWVRVRG